MNIKFPKLSLGNISPIRKDEKLNTMRNFPVESVLASKFFLESTKQTSSLDMSVVLPSKTKEQKLHLKEFFRLENELDIKEIELSKEKNTEKEISTYKSYLEGISFCLRFRDKELAKGIIRGLRGFLKIIAELLNKPTIIADKKKPKTKEIFSQTDEQAIPDDIENYNQEIQFLKSLETKLHTIKSSKVANRLFEAYDSLIKMHTTLPSPINTPEVLDIDEVTDKLQEKIVEIKEGLIAHVSKMQSKATKIDIETQTEVIRNINRNYTKNEENEEDLYYELQKKYEKVYNEKRKLEELLKGRKNVSDNIEDHLTHVELELFHYKKQASGYEDTIKNLKARNMAMKDKIENLEININLLKDEVKAANAKTDSKKSKIQELSEEVYKLTLNWKLNEKRLKELSEAWHKKIGKAYEHEEIDENELLRDIDLPKKKEKVQEEKIIKNTEAVSDRKINRTHGNRPTDTKKQNTKVENLKQAIATEACSQNQAILPGKQKANNKKIQKLPSESISPDPPKKSKSPKIPNNKPPKSQSPKLLRDSQIQTSKVKLNNSSIEIRAESPEDKKWKILKQKQEEKIQKTFKDDTQRELFEEYKAILERKTYKKPIKSPKVLNKSQEDSYTDLNSDANLSYISNSSENVSQKTIENYEENYEKIKKDPEFISAIGKVFDNEEEVDILPLQVRVSIMKALKGHERKKCGNKCDHLRRAMMIKYKEKGIPYPIKKVSAAD